MNRLTIHTFAHLVCIVSGILWSATTSAAIIRNPPNTADNRIGTTTIPNASVEVNGGSVLDVFGGLDVEIGVPAGTNGLLRVTGAGSQYNAIDQFRVGVGNEGAGEVIVEDGGYFGVLLSGATGNATLLISAPLGSGPGVVTVRGAGSIIELGQSRVFGDPGGPVETAGVLIGGSGGGLPELNVLDGGQFLIAPTTGGSNPVNTFQGLGAHITIAGGGSRLFNQAAGGTTLNERGDTGSLTLANGGILESPSRFGLETITRFGIGDDGSGNTASGMIVTDLLSIRAGIVGFELAVDPGTPLSIGDSFLLADYQTRSRTFPGAGPGAVVSADGHTFLMTYDVPLGGGRKGIFATVIPEPASAVLLGLGALLLVARRCIGRPSQV